MDRTIYLKTTDTCNLNCSHCFTGGNRPPRYFWDVEKTCDWLTRFIEHISQNDFVHFEFHGGEPMLAKVEELERVRDHIRQLKHPNITLGITTNLVFKLTKEREAFLLSLDGLGTSWDPDIRFSNEKQYELWKKNLLHLVELRKDKGIVLNISLSKKVVEMDQKELLHFLKDLKVTRVQFDRITPNGNANEHTYLFPSNEEINQWYLDIHNATEELDARTWFHNTSLEDIYAKFEKNFTNCGTFCRDCEEKNLTINGDGTISGCPNSAMEESFGEIDMEIDTLFTTSKRLEVMASERTRNDACYACEVFSYCGSDCHRLAWEGDICASPRQLMRQLAGLSYTENKTIPSRKVIPIQLI